MALARWPESDVVAVVTQPDRPKGRALKLQPSAVKMEAVRLGLAVLQPERARAEASVLALAALKPELIVVAAYGQILPPSILELPPHGCLNVHASLLPKYRGAAPIQWAILDDQPQTGVTIMKMDAGLDTGPMLTTAIVEITAADNSQTLHDRLAGTGAELLIKTLPDYLAGRIVPQAQPTDGVSYARKITKADGQLDWTQPARAVWNRVRALTPWPGAYTCLSKPGAGAPQLLKILAAEIDETPATSPGEILAADKGGIVVGCGERAIRILALQREGGRRLTAAEFLAGHSLRAGEKLG